MQDKQYFDCVVVHLQTNLNLSAFRDYTLDGFCSEVGKRVLQILARYKHSSLVKLCENADSNTDLDTLKKEAVSRLVSALYESRSKETV